MQPWIIEELEQLRQQRDRKTEVQPYLTIPNPMWEYPPDHECADDNEGVAIVDFEIKL